MSTTSSLQSLRSTLDAFEELLKKLQLTQTYRNEFNVYLPGNELLSNNTFDNKLPSNIRTYITTRLIPDFARQRVGYQFAVVMLLSESDYQNIEEIKYDPSNDQGKPFTNLAYSSMPQCEDYCNYIVARPDHSLDCHAEEVIFGQPSKFTWLWSAYNYIMRSFFSSPDYILIFSWILPCSKCTDLIIAALRERPAYKEATVFLAYVITWKKESFSDHERNIKKLTQNGVVVEQVVYGHRLQPQYTMLL